jgi:hypothetical protein
MQNNEQLPQIDEEALDGVAGGAGYTDALGPAAAIRDAASKTPVSIAGAAANFTGDVMEAWGNLFHKIGAALSAPASRDKA